MKKAIQGLCVLTTVLILFTLQNGFAQSRTTFISSATQTTAYPDHSASEKDQALLKKIRAEFMKSPLLAEEAKNLRMTSDDGRVVLQGKVSKPELRAKAELVAKKVPGLRSLKNEIDE